MLKDYLKKHGDFRDDLYFKELTTIKMGGKIENYVAPYNVEDLKSIISYCRKHNITYKILGNGSNILAGSDSYDGVVISLKRFDNYVIENNEVYVEAGVLAPYLSNVLAKHGLSGFEFASGIPGSIGGLVYMNAGAYKKEMSNILLEVTCLKEGEIVTLSKEELELSYRHSIFQNHPHWVVLSCRIQLEQGDSEEIRKLMDDRFKRRSETQPLDKPSAGSCFRNPLERAAWEYIDELGYRGYILNDVEVSSKHSNFIVNNGEGKAEDYLKIVYDIQEKVYEKYQVKLVMEVEKFNC